MGRKKNPNAVGLADLRDTIERMYSQACPADIAEMTGHTVSYVRCVASAMGIRCGRNGATGAPPWTLRQMRLLREQYGRTPVVHLARELERTAGAIRQKATAMKLGRRRGKLWTAQDDETRRRIAPEQGLAAAADAVGRSFYSVKHRCAALRLRLPARPAPVEKG